MLKIHRHLLLMAGAPAAGSEAEPTSTPCTTRLDNGLRSVLRLPSRDPLADFPGTNTP
ncbi:hypothetical protein PF008_g30331 [Phytophthora fragariae]|uniref:RxLR effector protein n=1 Tax=Phytophthora fragariae TaxID=53985 RepID=A0A6G0Q5W9_9STRA|nr:hypothetical protein PF008_g30331 [Phytophthora fragariae]